MSWQSLLEVDLLQVAAWMDVMFYNTSVDKIRKIGLIIYQITKLIKSWSFIYTVRATF